MVLPDVYIHPFPMLGNCKYMHVKTCMKPAKVITNVQLQDLNIHATSIQYMFIENLLETDGN